MPCFDRAKVTFTLALLSLPREIYVLFNVGVFLFWTPHGVPMTEKTTRILHIDLSGNLDLNRLNDLLDICEKNLPSGGVEGVILSGRLPVWAFVALAHLYHPRPFVATFDPRIGGAVVCESHINNVNVGDLIPVSEFGSCEKIAVTF